MAPSRMQSLVQPAGTTNVPAEFSAAEYENEVLRTGGHTEAVFDEALTREAEILGISRPHTPTPAHHAMSECATSVDSNHARTNSKDSNQSNSTALSSTSYDGQFEDSIAAQFRKRASHRRSLSFSEYEQYLAQTEAQPRKDMGFFIPSKTAEPSLFSMSTRKSYHNIRNSFKNRFRLRRVKPSLTNDLNPCICCREDFKQTQALHTLPCEHSYCETCLRVLISQASVDESKMPPRCCSKAIPGTIIKGLLNREEQNKFMKAVLQFSTPWEARIFCPDTTCGEFIPKRAKIDPKHPFEVVCQNCQTRACSICKSAAHALGQDCPSDWALEAVLEMGEKSGWRRCYKCRNLVELTHGCSHITCRCKAQFCYICGAVWDSSVGCPNYCNGEGELERRRQEEEARIAVLDAEADEKSAAEKRTQDSQELNTLRAQQIEERDRFCAFERKMKWIMWTRHGQSRLQILGNYGDLQTKMRERHAKVAVHLEDRQVQAEMELRLKFKQSKLSVAIRLRHMENYCDGLGGSANGTNPARTVTERDLRELGQQYNLRDDLERLHQSKINVMREKQAKQMEILLAYQDEELANLATKEADELEALDESFGCEEDGFAVLCGERRTRMSRRWLLAEKIARKKLEIDKGVGFAPLMVLEWPEPERKDDNALADVAE